MSQTPPASQQGPTEQELRELALRGESLRAQLQSMEAQREYVVELSGEARRSLTALEHLVSGKEGDEILIPLGAGAFIHGRLATAGVAIATLGAGVHAEMPIKDATDRLRARLESLDAAAQNLTRDVQRYADEMARINAVLETYYPGA